MTREPQYAACFATAAERGVTLLGVMANYDWHNNPRTLLFKMAHYQFVAKMFAGRNRVAEVGCGDGWCAPLVGAEVHNLSLFDFDPAMVRQAKLGEAGNVARLIHVHDMVANGRLPGSPYDGIYALDVFEHIPPGDSERCFLLNLVLSTALDGAVIIGCPSLESQPYASDLSLAGHVNCQSGKDLRNTLQRYFSQVFMFGMNDATLTTGFFPMCHYLFALCCGPRAL